MRANEKKIIQQYLRCAYEKLKLARKMDTQNRSERFPMLSQERIAAEHEFDILCSLARELDVPNPWEDSRFKED